MTRQLRNPCLPFSYYPAPRSPGSPRSPARPSPRPRLSEGDGRLLRFPYSLVYSVREHEMRILAVAHQKRRPFYWRGRE